MLMQISVSLREKTKKLNLLKFCGYWRGWDLWKLSWFQACFLSEKKSFLPTHWLRGLVSTRIAIARKDDRSPFKLVDGVSLVPLVVDQVQFPVTRQVELAHLEIWEIWEICGICFRQHCRFSVCCYFDWVWQILYVSDSKVQITTLILSDEEPCLIWFKL